MEINPFKDILQVEGLDDKGNQENGGRRQRKGWEPPLTTTIM